MFNIDEIKKKREEYETKIEELLKEYEKELPSMFKIESAVAVRESSSSKLICRIKLEVENVNR